MTGHLKIESTGPAPWDAKVFLDGHEVRGIVSLTLIIKGDSLNLCHITIEPDHVDVDAETLIALHNYLEPKQP